MGPLLAFAPGAAAREPDSTRAGPVSPDSVWELPRLSGPIRIDGRSDDPAWQAVPPVPLSVYLPSYGAPPTERTTARVAYDDQALYVMIDAWESHPGGVRASSMIRDDDSPGDFVNVLLDTYGDRQNGYGFSTTPGGQRNDWTISNDAQSSDALNIAWNGVWELATRRGPEGWHAEYRIPFSTLRFASDGRRVEFGLSLNRLTAHSNERVTFPAIEPSAPLALWKPSRWQRVAIENIDPGRSLRVTPYLLAGLAGSRGPDPARSPWTRDDRMEAGGDLKLGVTPSLTLDLTANTDFAEAEVDDQRVNLTRYPLFYPERRAFFLERAGTFEVKTGETDILFNSRRVGLTPTGEPVRLLGGARLVGRVAGWDVGVFDAQTGRNPAGVRENLGVVRVRHGVFNARSWAGVMVTSWATGDSSQAALAADGDLNLGGDDYVGFAAVALAGDAGVGSSQGVFPRGALRFRVERRRDRDFWYRAAIATTGARYVPALGYVERGDAIQPLGEIGYGFRVSQAGHLVRTSARMALDYRNAEGSLESSTGTITVSLEQPGGTMWTLTGNRQEDDLLQAFSPTPATTVPAGRYTADYLRLTLASPSGPRMVLGGSAQAGQYFDGTLYSLQLTPEWRASAHFRISGDLEVARVTFSDRGDRQWSRLARLKVLASATPQLSLTAVLQANSLADLATADFRLRYNLAEGHDVWVVYSHGLNLDRTRMDPEAPATARASLLVKYTRAFGR
ncbi:MAG TPA: DUF5916 domain-containing protein [Gemmatimonadales bacterium]|nr:DUF5916 domain-containing protein [Gemmatimonadales bacterium]